MIELQPALSHICNCDPSTDKYCIAPNTSVKDSTLDDLLDKYKDSGVYATVEYGPDDKCCMPMVTRKGEPCKLLKTDYACCYTHGRENKPMCVLNSQCRWGDLYSQ